MTSIHNLKGKRCPITGATINSIMRKAPVGESQTFLTDDPDAVNDIPALCEMRQYSYDKVSDTEYTIVKRV